jgi:hypothetical protein
MRTIGCVAALAGTLLLAAPGWAQHAVSFGGADPTKVVNQPVATPQPLGSAGASLSNLLPRVSLPSVGSLFGTGSAPSGSKHHKKPRRPQPQPQRPS